MLRDRPVPQRFADVLWLDRGRSFEIRYSARNFQDTVVPAGGQIEPFGGGLKQRSGCRMNLRTCVEPAAACVCVAGDAARVLKAQPLGSACDLDARANR